MLCVFLAQQILGKQLQDLESCLELLLKDSGPTGVHALRVATRRTDAAIFLCQDSLPAGVKPFFVRRCKRIRELSNKTRNHDVALAGFESASADQRLKKRLRATRRLECQQLVASITQWVAKQKMKRFRQLADQLNRFTLEHNVAVRAVQLAGQYVNASTEGLVRSNNLHHWRVATKRLRYALEFLQQCNCHVELEETLDTLKRLQHLLGETTDGILRCDLVETEGTCEQLSQVRIENPNWLIETAHIFHKVVETAQWCIGSEGMDASAQS